MKTTVPTTPIREYVGREVCGPCHYTELASHQKTAHAHTFRPMTVTALGKNAPPKGHISGTNSALRIRDARYSLVKPADGKELTLDYALVSGKQGMTFIKVVGKALLEMRKSYIPRTAKWYTTPGQEEYDDMPNGVGITHRGMVATKCIQCHAVAVPPDSVNPEPRFRGVGCESCHGPGSAHIAAVNARQTNRLEMEDLKSSGGDRINHLCGACHRTPEDAQMRPDAKHQTQRFMPYGLSLIRCFQKSDGRLACITGHNPHANASTDHKAYEKICLNCHSSTPAPSLASDPTHTPLN